MNTNYHRKKQPALVRQQLLDVAAQFCVDQGPASLTLDAIARAAGVSKGGLLHHFPNKQALLEALADEVIDQINSQITEIMAADPESQGRFSRAYLQVICNHHDSGETRRTHALNVAFFGEESLNQRWLDWSEAKFLEHQATDSALSSWIVRLAADGLWLTDLAGAPPSLTLRRTEILQQLITLSRSL